MNRSIPLRLPDYEKKKVNSFHEFNTKRLFEKKKNSIKEILLLIYLLKLLLLTQEMKDQKLVREMFNLKRMKSMKILNTF